MPVSSEFRLPKEYRAIQDANLWPLVSPESFGAVGDGVTDDTTAFQAALNVGPVQLQGGKTYLTGKITTSYSITGHGATWKKKNGLNDWQIVITGDDVRISDIVFDGNQSNQSVINKGTIVGDGSTHVRFLAFRNTFSNTAGFGVYINALNNSSIIANWFVDSNGSAQFASNGCDGLLIYANHFNDFGHGQGANAYGVSQNAVWFAPAVAYGITNVVVSSNIFKTRYYFAGLTTGVTSNVITATVHAGQMPASGDPVVFSGTPPTGLTAGTTYYCIPINAATYSVSATQTSGVPGTAVTLTNGTGLNSICYLARTVAAVEAAQCRAVAISGNEIDGGIYGLSIGQIDRLQVTGNLVQNQELYGIECGNAGEGMQIVTGNNFIDCSSGVSFGGTSSIMNVSGNAFIHTSACPLLGQHISPQGGRISITGNTFINCSDITIKSIVDSENLLVSGNSAWWDEGRPTFGATTPPDPYFLVMGRNSTGLKVTGNLIETSVDGGASATQQGMILMYATSHENFDISNNTIRGLIAGATASGRIKATGIHLLSGAVFRNGKIKNNDVSGFAVGISTNLSTQTGISITDNDVYNNASNYILNGREIVRYAPPKGVVLGPAATINTTADQTSGWTTVLNAASVDLLMPGSSIYLNSVLKTVTAVTGAYTISQSATFNVATNVVTYGTSVPTSGTAVKFTTTGALPSGLSASTTYYVLPIATATSYLTSGQTGYADAVSRNTAAVTTFGNAGSGTNTVINAPTFLIDSTAASSSAGVTVKNDNGSGLLAPNAGATALSRATPSVGASPATYQNTSGSAQDISYFAGASVTLVDISQDGSTWSNVLTQSGAAVSFQRVLQPGEWSRITYTSTAPILVTTVHAG